MSEPLPPTSDPVHDPTVRPRPQVRQVSRYAMIAAICLLALLFFASTVVLNRPKNARQTPRLTSPPSSPTGTDAGIAALLSAAERQARLRQEEDRLSRERERALAEQLDLLNTAPLPEDEPFPEDEQGFDPPPPSRGSSAASGHDPGLSTGRSAQRRPDSAEARLQQALEAPILSSSRTSLRPTTEDTHDVPPLPDLARLLSAAAPAAQPQAQIPTSLQSRPANNPALSPLPPTPARTLLAGTAIPATLTSRILSDLPGTANALVAQDVWDTLTGKQLLIPRGARLFGRYSNEVGYGQNRLAVVWTRLTLPDGASFSLDAAPSADASGAAGLADRVDRHLGRLYGSALLLSIFTAAAQLSQPSTYDGNRSPSSSEIAAGALGQRVNDVSSALLEREMRVNPTITIGPGTSFAVVVTEDLVFPPHTLQ